MIRSQRENEYIETKICSACLSKLDDAIYRLRTPSINATATPRFRNTIIRDIPTGLKTTTKARPPCNLVLHVLEQTHPPWYEPWPHGISLYVLEAACLQKEAKPRGCATSTCTTNHPLAASAPLLYLVDTTLGTTVRIHDDAPRTPQDKLHAMHGWKCCRLWKRKLMSQRYWWMLEHA